MSPRTVRLRTALAAEWIKLTSVRSTIGALAAVGVMLPVLAAVVGLTGSLQPDDTVIGASLTGGAPAQIAAGVVGVLVIGGEYGSGTLRATLAARPDRGTVLAAKAVVVGGLTFVAAVAGAAVAAGVGRALITGHPSGAVVPGVLGAAAAITAVGLLGTGLGVLLRHTAGAVLAVAAAVLLPQLLAPLAGSWRGWVAGAGPVAVLQKLAQSSDADPSVVGGLGPVASLAVLTGYAMAALLVAGVVFRRRDA
ncbi:ABC transporter permease [Geodermatophilus marinus]|uniref:ABC transporter permease n=1 Tax=Geodermatophilus sp. LHW52908 TaxID=2303986 RepID=UPI000E3E5EB7|nr:ABC transporter permease [Geodermatophilus sp. LHW52908]RFU19003.1 ABC transporter permease [Geodermatophilus sp. LHW52908]